MIERQIVAQKAKERQIEEFIFSYLGKLSCSHIAMQRTPLGEKVSVYTSRPGLIVGKKGANIRKLTALLKTRFKMENPQLEVVEIENPFMDASSVARTLMSGFERFGPKRFKAMAYRALDNAMKAGAKGIEIVIAGRGVPSERAKTWRFTAGYLKKSGDVSATSIDRSYESCNLRSGTIGIKVSILHPDVILPDDIQFYDEKEEKAKEEEVKGEESIKQEAKIIEKATEKKSEKKEEKVEEKKPKKKKKTVKKAVKKKVEKKDEEKKDGSEKE